MIAVSNSSFMLSQLNDDNKSIKFGLHVKNQELKQLRALLTKILALPDKKRNKMIKDNSEFINQLMLSYLGDCKYALNGMHLDPEGLDMSTRFMANFKEVMNTLSGLLHKQSSQMYYKTQVMDEIMEEIEDLEDEF